MKNRKYALLISGGSINVDFVTNYIKNKNYDMIVAIDGGLESADKMGIVPTHIVGDFDTVSSGILKKYENNLNIDIKRLNPEKDLTDTQAAAEFVIESKCTDADIVGASGTRLDHTIANIQMLRMFCGKCRAVMVNENNRVRVVDSTITLKRKEMFGEYVSLLPLTDRVTGVTLCGFKYTLKDYEFAIDRTYSLGVSNEMTDDTAVVKLKSGALILIESRD